ncbi:MAG: CARDB domain-containing protein, partial [Saprospiraceae bacterium]
SADNIINLQDLILLSKNQFTLAPGASVSDTVVVQVPVGYFGNYILILQTDANNQLYEYTGENNNILTRSINIINPPPSDLKVSSVIVPVSVIAGDNINISWTTNNIGSNPASGVFREVVYISADSIWNTQDPVFGIKDQTIYLPPAGHINQQLTDNVTGVATGDYYAIVQTDARQNFNESDETNNFTASADVMNVDVKTLYLDSLTHDNLQNNLELYYKIVVGPDLDGETILLDLKGDSIFGLNELYVKLNQMPTRADFDFGFDKPFQSNQQIILPNVHPGTYYILAYGFTLDNSIQDITLYAKVIDYEILSLAPKHGIQNTQVTLKITGSKLQNTLQWRLRQNDPWFSRDAVSAYVVNDNLAFVTFDLTDMAVDTYAVDLIKADSSLAFIDDFMVEADGGQPKLQINGQLPGAVPGRPVPVQIVLTFINNGEADVINQAIRVEAPYGNIISTSLENLQAGIGESVLIVPLLEENGPPGIIRPGASGRIEIYASSGPTAVYGIRLND